MIMLSNSSSCCKLSRHSRSASLSSSVEEVVSVEGNESKSSSSSSVGDEVSGDSGIMYELKLLKDI